MAGSIVNVVFMDGHAATMRRIFSLLSFISPSSSVLVGPVSFSRLSHQSL
jgi:prepilin-type processing-associated H-X9-DG protein